MNYNELDPKGLMKDSYAIVGITEQECRSIFLDWVLGIAISDDVQPRINLLLDVYAAENPIHPMTKTLRYGLDMPANASRNGGRKGRID